jgi:hypothetical protein
VEGNSRPLAQFFSPIPETKYIQLTMTKTTHMRKNNRLASASARANVAVLRRPVASQGMLRTGGHFRSRHSFRNAEAQVKGDGENSNAAHLTHHGATKVSSAISLLSSDKRREGGKIRRRRFVGKPESEPT